MKKLIVGLFCCALMLVVTNVACSPSKPTIPEANADINQMVFVRHANGLCFGVVRFVTYSGYQGVTITNVPKDACQ